MNVVEGGTSVSEARAAAPQAPRADFTGRFHGHPELAPAGVVMVAPDACLPDRTNLVAPDACLPIEPTYGM